MIAGQAMRKRIDFTSSCPTIYFLVFKAISAPSGGQQMSGDRVGRRLARTGYRALALQLPSMKLSESMGNHDSKIVDADSVD